MTSATARHIMYRTMEGDNMRTFDVFLLADARLRRWSGILRCLLILVAVAMLVFTVIGLVSAQSDELGVSISADSGSLQPGEIVSLTADISNAPPNKSPEYDWAICTTGICIPSSAYPLKFGWDKPMT